eukprot:362984-Chlamydomonas_euryale.AAC.3
MRATSRQDNAALCRLPCARGPGPSRASPAAKQKTRLATKQALPMPPFRCCIPAASTNHQIAARHLSCISSGMPAVLRERLGMYCSLSQSAYVRHPHHSTQHSKGHRAVSLGRDPPYSPAAATAPPPQVSRITCRSRVVFREGGNQ